MHRRHLAAVGDVQLDAIKGQAVEEIGDIGELAPEPVDGLGDDDIEAPRLGIGEQALEIGTKPAGAALRAVLIGGGQGPALARDVAAADFQLVFDGCVALVVGGIASVDDGAEGHGRSSSGRAGDDVAPSPCRSRMTHGFRGKSRGMTVNASGHDA